MGLLYKREKRALLGYAVIMVLVGAVISLIITLQQVLAANAMEESTFDPSQESEDVLTALFTDRSEKIDEITEWKSEVPPVLVASSYAP